MRVPETIPDSALKRLGGELAELLDDDQWNNTEQRYLLPALEEREALLAQVGDLAMLIRMLVHSVHKANPDNETARKAMDYLKRHNLQGSILRDALRDEEDYGAGDCVPTER